jgi:hypothetical protein
MPNRLGRHSVATFRGSWTRAGLTTAAVGFVLIVLLAPGPSVAATSRLHLSPSSAAPLPSWWGKFEYLRSGGGSSFGASVAPAASNNTTVGANIDVSREPGPQSETSIAIDPTNAKLLVAGSNEINRNPMRAYYSSDSGKTWGAVDLPLPPPIAGSAVDFGSDPGVAWDLRGEVYYSYIVVYFSAGFAAVTGSEMAVARSLDHGHTWNATYFALQSAANPFDDKPMIAVDTHANSSFANRVYVAWDLTGTDHSDGDAILVSHSGNHGVNFTAPVAASPSTGETRKGVIGADPVVSADGNLYVAWNDFQKWTLEVSGSTDGGVTFGSVHTIAKDRIGFDISIPAQNSRHALLYPACGASPNDSDTPAAPDRLYCSWIDGNFSAGVNLYFARSSDGGATWSAPLRVTDDNPVAVHDHFNQWLAVDPVTGRIHVSWYDTRLDPTRHSTNVFWAQSTDNGTTFLKNMRVTTAPTNERTKGADFGNQYGDYEGIAAYGGVVYPVWTDRRVTVSFLGEEVFTAAIDAD